MSKYDDKSLTELWILLAFLEQNNHINSQLQDKIKYQVEKNVLTDSEVAPLIQKTTEAFIAIDEVTIEIEKAMDKQVRVRTGIRHLSGSTVRFNEELEALVNKRRKEKKDDYKGMNNIDDRHLRPESGGIKYD